MTSRAKVERLYICTELHSRISSVWLKFMLPPTIVSVSLAIIVSTFVSIRYTELPLCYYVYFPNSAFTLMVNIFWLGYDGVLITRDSEGILGQLRSSQAPYLRSVPKHVRTLVMKRVRAMRVLEFRVGDFANFSVNVPISIWDEILNQVVFLLSF